MTIATKVLRLVLLACMAIPFLSAGTISPCPTASLSVYLSANTPCSVGSLEFSGFAYNNSYFPTLPGPLAGAITVTPSTNGANPGLDFSAAWNVTNGVGMDSALTYLVQTISGLPTITSASFGMDENISRPTVSVQVSETLCIGLPLGAGKCPAADLISLTIPNGQGYQQTSVSFGPVSQLTIGNDIFIKSNGGTGSISHVGNNLPSGVPEPGTWVLLVSGLALIGTARLGMRRLAR